MSLKIIGNLINDSKPVIESSCTTISCKDFKGEISSITGIIHRSIYISKLRESFGEVLVENPTIRVVCGSECKERCINLKI